MDKLFKTTLNHSIYFFTTFGIALVITMMLLGDRLTLASDSTGFYIFLVEKLFIIAYLPKFPNGLIAVFTQTFNNASFDGMFSLIGWFIYLVIFLSGVFVKNRSVFTFIYFAFVILLIMNITGCVKISPYYFP